MRPAMTTPDAPIEWRHGVGCTLEFNNGHAVFHYHPAKREMEWRGKVYFGVASEDIDRFVRNRTDL